MIQVDEQRELLGSMELRFRCSFCGHTNPVDVLRIKTVEEWAGPTKVTYDTVVKCPACKSTFSSKLNLDELSQLQLHDVSGYFRARIGLVARFFVITGWLFSWCPPIGLLMFAVALTLVPNGAKNWRRGVMVGLGISTLAFILLLAAIALGI